MKDLGQNKILGMLFFLIINNPIMLFSMNLFLKIEYLMFIIFLKLYMFKQQ